MCKLNSLSFWIWQHQKRSNSARLPQFWNLTLDNVKNEAILRDFLIFWSWQRQKTSNSTRLPSKMQVGCRNDGLVPMRFAIFPLHLSKVLRLPRKRDARSYEVLHLSRKIISANLKIWCSKMQPLSGNQRPHLLTSLMNMFLVLRDMHLCRSSSNVPRLPSFVEMLQTPEVLLTFDKVHNRRQLAKWEINEIKNCTPLWREAHFEVKCNYVQNTSAPEHF